MGAVEAFLWIVLGQSWSFSKEPLSTPEAVMRLRSEQGEQEILELLKVMSRMAKSAKRIEEITEVMDNISFQAALLTLDANILAAESGKSWDGLSSVKSSVRDSSEEMYFQFNLLLDEVSDMKRLVGDKGQRFAKSKDLN